MECGVLIVYIVINILKVVSYWLIVRFFCFGLMCLK